MRIGARWAAWLGRGVTCALVAGALLGAQSAACAEKQPPVWKAGSEPLQVDSKTLETLGNEGVVIFQGDVSARQGDVTLQADRVEVKVNKATRAIESVQARGNVRIRKGEILASGDEASYDAATGVVVLTGSPKVWRGQDVVAGNRITLYLAEDRSVVEGARAVIYQGRPEGGGAK